MKGFFVGIINESPHISRLPLTERGCGFSAIVPGFYSQGQQLLENLFKRLVFVMSDLPDFFHERRIDGDGGSHVPRIAEGCIDVNQNDAKMQVMGTITFGLSDTTC